MPQADDSLPAWGILFLLYYQYMEKFTYLPRTKLSSLPKAPGVYALSSPKAILYIGKATNIKDRVKNHFQQTSYRDNLFIQDITKVGYIKTESDIDALLLESQLIKKLQPKYNVMWKDDKKYFYVAITKEQFPRVFLTHQPALPKLSLGKTKFRLGSIEYIGPFVEGKAIKRVLRLLRRVFPYYTAKKHGSLSCSWCHLNLCPGPSPDLKEYKKNIKNLVSVLKGKKTTVFQQLEKGMKGAAKNQYFEKASVLRDQLLSLERIVSHARLFSPEISDSLNWKLVGKELQKLLETKKGISHIEAYDISNIQGKEATGSQVTFRKGVPLKASYRKYKIRITGKPDDFSMMKELIERRLRHKEWPYPQLIVIDGGKGQLSSALKVISTLVKLSSPQLSLTRLQSIKVVALAKKQNELFFPGKPKSVLLRDLPRPLENLFLHIRDEAHRFAVKYHRALRSKALFSQ